MTSTCHLFGELLPTLIYHRFTTDKGGKRGSLLLFQQNQLEKWGNGQLPLFTSSLPEQASTMTLLGELGVCGVASSSQAVCPPHSPGVALISPPFYRRAISQTAKGLTQGHTKLGWHRGGPHRPAPST